MAITRRNLLYLLGATAGATTLGVLSRRTIAPSFAQEATIYPVIPLPYSLDALEPYIDKETMNFHYGKHYTGYAKNLNAAVAKYPELKEMSAEALLQNLNSLPSDIKTTVRNNGGGYVNHTMFWQIMAPPSPAGGKPTGAIAEAINGSFGSFDAFKDEFNHAGGSRFGSGWAWLVLDKNGKLDIISTPNQDSPLMEGLYPIMGNDVWEHAYYLKYKNDRGEYLKQWWNVVNWDEVNKRFAQAKA